ncbi:MAG: hypothetical protein A2172_03275 [Candidatus Woykebacteria bacterium RBG_13_40_15]|uniref:Uncharacterized protein n=1 Tax=Candidatus Woykebacteria bacterium RBG_13_40_15 TaxID=1802593 RepID=A0A1G1W5R7_9BACT|nr:MAG: hypothetical protein A2172_03275 [Candidatus Woykebacteria bacterium RBG_13_40_15]
MLLFCLPKGLDLTLNDGKWAEAIRLLREQFENEYSGLFEGFSFVERSPAFPYCQQVSGFLTWILLGIVETIHRAGSSRMRVIDTAREESLRYYESRVGEQERAAIKEMASWLVTNERTRQLLVVPS